MKKLLLTGVAVLLATGAAHAYDAAKDYRRQMWLDQAPFLIGHITLVPRGFAAIVLSGGCGPHGNS